MHWNPEPAPNHGFWAVTRYDDIGAVDRDAETFTSEQFVNLEEVSPRTARSGGRCSRPTVRGTGPCAS